ncbi:hypothetical protein HK413_05940 [Mucilaginibacter sp. S1162]|uniref:Uncharacterized protein n=1 Tax=Mucilaginibacter humi TaxID=2732510 RepID=A0ABX1W1R3_9SPHI|nr:hypothetical protein [Mucilaginibacter humi]
MQTNPKPLLVVTLNTNSIVVPTRKNTVHIDNARRIFPAIHELQPTGIILDYDFWVMIQKKYCAA